MTYKTYIKQNPTPIPSNPSNIYPKTAKRAEYDVETTSFQKKNFASPLAT